MTNEKKQQKPPTIVWLRVTDYMQEWLQRELGGEAGVRDMRVVSVQHLSGTRGVLRMPTMRNAELTARQVGNSMSAMEYNIVSDLLQIDERLVSDRWGLTRESMPLYAPIECPPMCINADGLLRPWTLYVRFGDRQAHEMLKLLREQFWQAVSAFAADYAREHEGEKYAQEEMIEAFCKATGTPDIHVPAMRREWQRRRKSLQTG